MRLIKLLLLGLAITPVAQANLVTNGGFEEPGTLAATPGYQYLPNNNTSVTGWTSISDGIGEDSYLMNKDRTNLTYVPRVYAGTYALALNTGNAIQTQVGLVSGTSYDLSFWARANVAGASALQITLGDLALSFANTTSFTQFNYHFTASNSDPAAILKFFNPSANGGNRAWALDNVSLEPAPVPLPTAIWPFLTGFTGLVALSKRRRLVA